MGSALCLTGLAEAARASPRGSLVEARYLLLRGQGGQRDAARQEAKVRLLVATKLYGPLIRPELVPRTRVAWIVPDCPPGDVRMVIGTATDLPREHITR